MTAKKLNVDPQRVAKDLGEKIQSVVKGGNNIQNIPDIVVDTLKSYGIELPEKAKQAIQEYQRKLSDNP